MKLLHEAYIQDSRNLDNIENHSCQTLFTSPPYNLGGFNRNQSKVRPRAYDGYDDAMPEDDYRDMLEEILGECIKKMKSNGAIFWNMKARVFKKETVTPHWFIDIAKKFNLTLTNEIIWEFPSGADTTKTKFWGRHETIFYFRLDKDNYIFNLDDIRVPTKYDTDTRYDPKGKNPASVWHLYASKNEVDIEKLADNFEFTVFGQVWYVKHNLNYGDAHPATFPVELPWRGILATTNPGDTVIDPFVGSGQTMVAAKQLNRNSIGIDKSKKYIKLTLKNLGYMQKDLTKFLGGNKHIIKVGYIK